MGKLSATNCEQMLKLRHATVHDALAIAEIRVAAWQAAYGKFMPSDYLAALDPRSSALQLQQVLTDLPSEMVVTIGEYKEQLVGFTIIGKPRYQAEDGTIELWAINVRPQFWQKGLGSLLLQAAIKNATNCQYKQLQLWCIKGNAPAENTYYRHGFTNCQVARTTDKLTGHPLEEQLYMRIL